MRTPVGVDLEEAQEKLLALTTQSSRLTAGLGGMEEARRALSRICDDHAAMGAKLAESFAGMHRLHEAAQATGGLGAQVAEQSAKWQEAVDRLTTGVNSVHGGMISDTALLGNTAAYSQALHDLVNRNYDLSSRLDDRIADLAADVPHDALVNPIHETNEKLDQLLAMQVDIAKLHQGLNETTLTFLSYFKNVAQKTSRQTNVVVAATLLMLVITSVGVWLNRTSSNDIITANQEMIESLTDRIATIQSNMAARSADEREAMQAEQRRLIEQLINTTQALIEQQAIKQRAAIEQLKDVLERQRGEVRPESK